MELDRFDRQLLNIIQDDLGQTSERLAEQVHLSPSAVQRRLKRLRKDGIIARECAVLEPKKIGRPTFFIVSLQVERERPELLAELRRWLSREPHIQQAFYVTGEADFVLIVTVPDTDAYDELMSRTRSRKFQLEAIHDQRCPGRCEARANNTCATGRIMDCAEIPPTL